MFFKSLWSLEGWSCRVHSEIIDSHKELLTVAKSDGKLVDGDYRERKFPGMGSFSLKERASVNREGREKLAFCPPSWPIDHRFMVSCLLSGVRWHLATKAVCPGVRRSHGCAQWQPAWNRWWHHLLIEVLCSAQSYQTWVVSVLAWGFLCLAQEALWGPIMRNDPMAYCRNMWDSSVLIMFWMDWRRGMDSKCPHLCCCHR